MIKLIIVKAALVSLCHFTFYGIIQAQNMPYDPLLDTSVVVLDTNKITGNGEYIWHPGQLSAHLQRIRLHESNERCVNVGYPGKFYAPVNKIFFRKEVNFLSETFLDWKSTGKVHLFVNGKESVKTGNPIKLPKGKSIVLFVVETETNLPAIKVTFNGQASFEGWNASMDGKEWYFAETSPVFGTAGRMPLDDPELLVELKPSSVLSIRNASIGADKISIHKNGYVLIDFYYLEVGEVSFISKGKGNLTAFVGESPEEALNENTKLFEQFLIEPYVLSESETQITLPERAVRYVKLFCDGECEISALKFKSKIWPVEFKMSFECNDERINNIWGASVATLHSSMHGFYLDGIKRDYLPWSMDAVVSTIAGDYLFGDEQVSRNSFSVALLPLNPQISDIGIPDYPLHALLGFKHYYQRYGDFNVILSYRDRIEQLLQLYEALQDERGFISANIGVNWGFVPGWATTQGPDTQGTPAYAQIMLYYNYKIGAQFSEKWGDKKSAKHYEIKAESLRNNIMKHFWDEEKGIFYNGYAKAGTLDMGISHHAQYWGILASIFPETQIDNLFETLPKIAHYRDNVSFEKGYEFLAYSKAGKVREMWDFLLDVFGDWLEQGHTRFPENFSYKKTRDEQLAFYGRPFGLSLCHGANGVPGVVAVLNGIVGFSQSEIYPNQYTIRPDMMDLEWATIEFPIKEGKIGLKLSKEGKTEIEIPAGCTIDYIDKNNKKTVLANKGLYYL